MFLLVQWDARFNASICFSAMVVQGLCGRRLRRILLPRTPLNKGINKGRSHEARPLFMPLPEVAKRSSSYCSGLRYVCSPAFRIASMPSSALSKVVVLEDFTCPGEMAAKTVAAAVLSSGAS
jgi:hypothetical protein